MIPTVVISLKSVEMRNWVVDLLKKQFNPIKLIVVPVVSRRDIRANLKHWDGVSPLLVILDVPSLATEADWVPWRKRFPLGAATLYLGQDFSSPETPGFDEGVFTRSVEYFLKEGDASYG